MVQINMPSEDVEAYRKNYDLCKKYMFYANREMNCKHPNCPAGGCRISFTPDLNQSIGTVEIPCYIIEGFKPEEVVWNEDEKVGQRRCSTSTDKYWYIDVIEMSMKSQKDNKYQPAYKIRAINERQLNRRVRAEIQKVQRTEQCQVANGAGCKFEDLRNLTGGDKKVPGVYLNHLMPQQQNMQEIVDANVLSLMHIKSEQIMPTINYKQGDTYDPATGQEYDEDDLQFQSKEAIRKNHPLASSSYYNLADISVNEQKVSMNTPALKSNVKMISLKHNQISRNDGDLSESSQRLSPKRTILPTCKCPNAKLNEYRVHEESLLVLPDINAKTSIHTRQHTRKHKLKVSKR